MQSSHTERTGAIGPTPNEEQEAQFQEYSQTKMTLIKRLLQLEEDQKKIDEYYQQIDQIEDNLNWRLNKFLSKKDLDAQNSKLQEDIHLLQTQIDKPSLMCRYIARKNYYLKNLVEEVDDQEKKDEYDKARQELAAIDLSAEQKNVDIDLLIHDMECSTVKLKSELTFILLKRLQENIAISHQLIRGLIDLHPKNMQLRKDIDDRLMDIADENPVEIISLPKYFRRCNEEVLQLNEILRISISQDQEQSKISSIADNRSSYFYKLSQNETAQSESKLTTDQLECELRAKPAIPN